MFKPGRITGPEELCRALALPLPRLLAEGVKEPGNVDVVVADGLGVKIVGRAETLKNEVNFEQYKGILFPIVIFLCLCFIGNTRFKVKKLVRLAPKALLLVYLLLKLKF